MGKLNQIDKAADSKGKGIVTLWQFVKFIVVSLGAFVIQTVLPIIIQLFMSDEFINQKYEFFVFASAGGEGIPIRKTKSALRATLKREPVGALKPSNAAEIPPLFPHRFAEAAYFLTV